MTEPQRLATVADVARQLGVSPGRVGYAARTRSIAPSSWAGPVRLYDLAAVEAIAAVVAETSGKKAPGRPVTSRKGDAGGGAHPEPGAETHHPTQGGPHGRPEAT